MTAFPGPVSRRRFLHLSAAAAAATYLPACTSASPQRGRTVRLAGSSFGFPSPFAYIAGPGYVQMSLLYDTLMWKDGTGELLPWIASSVERLDGGRTYRFTIRPGITWHDGLPLTVDDVVFTFQYFLGLTLGPLLIAQPIGVSGVRAVDSDTVDVRLRRPAVTFLEQVAAALPIIPRHIWSAVKDPRREQDLKMLVGSGPYRLTSFSRGDGSLAFDANLEHFLGRPYVRRVEFLPVDDEFDALRAGQIDVADAPVDGVRPATLAPFRRDSGYALVQRTGGFSFPLIFNLGRGGALADPVFRRACAMAIDRGDVVTRLLGGNGVPGNPGFLPPDHPEHVSVQQYPSDPAGAIRLLDAAGYGPTNDGTRRARNGQPLRFEILTGNSPVPPVLPLLVDALGKIGVRLDPVAVDLPTLFGRLQDSADDIVLSLYPGPGGTAPEADPDVLRTFYSSRISGRLQGAQGWVDKEFDSLADKQLVESDTQVRAAQLARMQKIIARDVPAVPLYYPTLVTAFRPTVFDAWYHTPGGFAGGLPGVHNKHVLITGRRGGLAIRAS